MNYPAVQLQDISGNEATPARINSFRRGFHQLCRSDIGVIRETCGKNKAETGPIAIGFGESNSKKIKKNLIMQFIP